MPHYDDTLDPARVAAELFGESGVEGIDKLFALTDFPPRVRLACLLLSAGAAGELRQAIDQARQDARDVMYWAYYYEDEAPAAMRRYLRME